jgi:serine protease Do
MSVGIISALERSLPKLSRKENRLYSNLIQTTAQINPGNSGGPLFDLNGDVIGINTAVILPEKKANGIGFAIPITPQFISTIHDLMEGREVVYGYLGVVVSTPTDRERQLAKVDGDYGVRIDSVETDSPAGERGLLKERDVIVQVNGELVRDSEHFVRIIGCTPAEKEARLTVYRGGKPVEVAVTLRRRQVVSAGVTRERQRFHWQGMLLGPIPANWDFSKSTRPTCGLMVLGITQSSPFSKEQIAEGDVITAVAGKPIPDVTALQRVLSEAPVTKCQITVHGRPDAVVTISE